MARQIPLFSEKKRCGVQVPQSRACLLSTASLHVSLFDVLNLVTDVVLLNISLSDKVHLASGSIRKLQLLA